MGHDGGMHIGALRYLVAVVDEGSFGRAARRLHVAQPSVSQAILRLEEQFGLTLLDRSGARVVATAEGAQVIEDVRAALAHLDRAFERASGSTSTASLRIGCTNLAGMWLMPELLEGFRVARPDIAVAVAELDVPAQAEALLAGRIDMTIGDGLPWHSDLDAVVVREHPCAIWMAAAHPLASHAAIALRMLEGIPLALGHPEVMPTYGPWVLEQLDHVGVVPTIAPPVRDTASGFRAILAGECVALAPDMVSEHAMPGLAVRSVIEPIRYPWTVTRARSRAVPAADAFVSWADQATPAGSPRPPARPAPPLGPDPVGVGAGQCVALVQIREYRQSRCRRKRTCGSVCSARRRMVA